MPSTFAFRPATRPAADPWHLYRREQSAFGLALVAFEHGETADSLMKLWEHFTITGRRVPSPETQERVRAMLVAIEAAVAAKARKS